MKNVKLTRTFAIIVLTAALLVGGGTIVAIAIPSSPEIPQGPATQFLASAVDADEPYLRPAPGKVLRILASTRRPAKTRQLWNS